MITTIAENIKQGDFALSNSINNTIIASNILEQNQQTINNLILQKLIDTNYVYSISDINTLYSIGEQCPIAGGNAVYQARNLLMTIANDVLEFVDNCNEAPKRSRIIASQSKNIKNYGLYPNPNDGEMTLEYTLPSNSIGNLVIYDVTGKAIATYTLMEGNENKLKINQKQLDNGVYFYSVLVNNKIMEHNKIVVIK